MHKSIRSRRCFRYSHPSDEEKFLMSNIAASDKAFAATISPLSRSWLLRASIIEMSNAYSNSGWAPVRILMHDILNWSFSNASSVERLLLVFERALDAVLPCDVPLGGASVASVLNCLQNLNFRRQVKRTIRSASCHCRDCATMPAGRFTNTRGNIQIGLARQRDHARLRLRWADGLSLPPHHFRRCRQLRCGCRQYLTLTLHELWRCSQLRC